MISLKITLEKFFRVAHVLQTAVDYTAEKQKEVLIDVKDYIQFQDLQENDFLTCYSSIGVVGCIFIHLFVYLQE